jgi:hypothetical protein
MSEVLDVRSLGTLKTEDFIVEEAVSGFEFCVDRVEALELGGL